MSSFKWPSEGTSNPGTVTSVGLTAPSTIMSVAGSPVTSSGTLAISLLTQSANKVWAGPTTGSAATPTFRSLVAADLPAGGDLTDVGTDGITIGNGVGAVIGSGTTISQHVADASHNGYLSSTDWSAFSAGGANAFHYLSSNSSVYGGTFSTLGFTGANNTVVGVGAGSSLAAGDNNTLYGRLAGNGVGAGHYNTAFGLQAVGALTTGSNNVGIGPLALGATNGTGNVGIGYNAGRYETGSNKFFIGNVDQSTEANDRAFSLLYGVFAGSAGTTSGQSLTINGALTTTGTNTLSALSTGIAHLNSSGVVSSSAVNLASADVTGLLPIANGGTGAATTSQNFAFIGPTSGSGAPSFRALVAGDLPSLGYIPTIGTSTNTALALWSGTAGAALLNSLHTVASTGQYVENYSGSITGALHNIKMGTATTWNAGLLIDGTFATAAEAKVVLNVKPTIPDTSSGVGYFLSRVAPANGPTLSGSNSGITAHYIDVEASVNGGQFGGVNFGAFGIQGLTSIALNSNTSGWGSGVIGLAGGNRAVGTYGGAFILAGSTPKMVGVSGGALYSTSQATGVYAYITTSATTAEQGRVPNVTAALVANNGDTAQNIAAFQSNGTNIATVTPTGIDSAGTINLSASSSANLTWTTDGAGNIGDATHRPDAAYVKTTLVAKGYHLEPLETGSVNSSTAVTLDMSTASSKAVLMTGNSTITLSNMVAGGTYVINITGGGSNYTVTLAGTVVWLNASAAAPAAVPATTGRLVMSIYYDGTSQLVTFAGNYAV